MFNNNNGNAINEQGSLTFIPCQRTSLSFDTRCVDEYILGETLGQGSCAIVKLGTHRVTGEKVAVKIVRPSTMQKQKEVLREVEALRVLKSHPHIIKLIKVIKENGFVCLILELGKGGELFNYILDNGRMTEVQARKVFRQVLSAVQYCHAHLIVHRDLKPENIMLDADGNAKITDFGLSNFLKPNNLFSTFCGSPIYTSPEIVLHRKYNGALADVWSLGVVLFVMVTGGMPWRLENNKVQNIESLLSAQFRLPDSLGLSEECKDLIRIMLTAESRDRASIESIVNHSWVMTGYDSAPSALLDSQPVVRLNDINFDLVKQLSQLSMDVTKACTAIQEDSCSPALTAYRSLLNKHARAMKVSENVAVPDLTNSPPLSPSRMRARSDPASDKLKMEKTRMQKIKEQDVVRAEGEAAEVAEKLEKEKIREKIKRWKAMHKTEQSKNSAIVNQSTHVNLDSGSTITYAPQPADKTRKEKIKSFFTYFRRQHAGNGNGTIADGASTISHIDVQTTKLPLKLNPSPISVRRSPAPTRHSPGALRHSPRVDRR